MNTDRVQGENGKEKIENWNGRVNREMGRHRG
jgi:hypothetical protein